MDSAGQDTSAWLAGEGKYRLLVDSVTDYAIYMLDANGIVSSWNSGAQRVKGYTEAEILGQHFSRFYSEEDRRAGLPQRALDTAAREGRFEGEGWRVRKDGVRFWAQVLIDPIRTPDGRLAGYAKVTRDLSERRVAAELLKRSEDQFNLLVQSVTDYAIYMLDTLGRVSSWNQGAQRIKGYAPEEIIGSHFSRFYSGEDRARELPAHALDTARREGRFEGEGWRVRKDGSRFWAHVIIDRIADEQGRVIGYAKVTRDVTEKREAQRQLEAAREAFFQSQKLEAIGQLTGGVAHDFNNLLMAVLASLALLRKRVPDDPRTTGLIDNAIRGARRGAALTQRMLAFARRQDLKPVPVDVPELVRGMSALVGQTPAPGVSMRVHHAPGLPPVLADANQLELALLNLALNARDAMPEGGAIEIASREAAEHEAQALGLAAGRYVCLSVADSGTGMDAATLARAAEPFFTTKGVGKGTGLGLSMVDGLAAQSGGRLLLRSERGSGTVAELWLPVAPTGVQQAAPAEPAAVAAAPTPPLRVLVVDDDALVLTNTVTMLQDLGHTVLEAGSGRAALELLACDAAIELLVTDHAMPGMTGLQLIEAARAHHPKLRCMLATGYAELAVHRPPPGLPVLSKPFDQEALAQAVAAAFNAAAGA